MIPLFKFFDVSDRIIYPTGADYPQLFPTGTALSSETQSQIMTQFANRLTCHAKPQYWLGRWWALITREETKWIKLIESESTLNPDDGRWNYDMHETESVGYSGTSSSTSKSASTNNATSNAFASDTPDNAVDDIETYMSTASRDVASNTSSGDGSASADEAGESDRTLRRYGNIGVMTSAQIMGGYRESIRYCAYDDIFRELEPMFIQDFGDVGNQYGYDLEGWMDA